MTDDRGDALNSNNNSGTNTNNMSGGAGDKVAIQASHRLQAECVAPQSHQQPQPPQRSNAVPPTRQHSLLLLVSGSNGSNDASSSGGNGAPPNDVVEVGLENFSQKLCKYKIELFLRNSSLNTH